MAGICSAHPGYVAGCPQCQCSPVKLIYFGCYRETGHFFWRPGMQYAPYDGNVTPWGWAIDGGLCPGASTNPDRTWERGRPEVEGEVVLHHKNGWTALAFWDRSVDQRPGSNSVFCAEGNFTFEEMCALAQQHFPTVWSRFKFTVRLAEPVGVTR